MDHLKDSQFLITVVVLISSAAGNYFAITSKFELEINHLKQKADTHINKEYYEVRTSYIENELANHQAHIHELDSYLMKRYPDWKDYYLNQKRKEHATN